MEHTIAFDKWIWRKNTRIYIWENYELTCRQLWRERVRKNSWFCSSKSFRTHQKSSANTTEITTCSTSQACALNRNYYYYSKDYANNFVSSFSNFTPFSWVFCYQIGSSLHCIFLLSVEIKVLKVSQLVWVSVCSEIIEKLRKQSVTNDLSCIVTVERKFPRNII